LPNAGFVYGKTNGQSVDEHANGAIGPSAAAHAAQQ
jgi:hypothetical protein